MATFSPINYTMNVADPATRVLQGAAAGQDLIGAAEQRGIALDQNERAQAAEGRAQQIFPLQMQQAELGIQSAQLGLQAEQQRIAAAQQQLDRTNAFRQGWSDLVMKGTQATVEDFDALNAQFPEMSKATMEYYDQLDERRHRPLVSTLAQAATALKSGNADIGIQVARDFAEAARSAGDPQLAAMAESAVKLAEIDPDAAYAQIGTLLMQVDPDLAKGVLSGGEEPAAVTSLKLRAAEAGLEPGSNEYREFMLSGGAEKGIAIEVGPDGTVRFAEGGAGDSIFGDKPPTEGQLASAGFLQRMTGAEDTFAVLAAEGIDRIPFFAGQTVGSAAENLALNENQRRLLQARRDWVRAKLRKESGAVIGDQEMTDEMMTYFPQPGDGPQVVEQKRIARERATRQMQITAGPAAPMAEDQEQAAGDGQRSAIEEQAARFGVTPEEANFVVEMQRLKSEGQQLVPEQVQRLQQINQKMVRQ